MQMEGVPPEKNSDEQLAAAAAAGSIAAEELLIGRYTRLVRALSRPFFLVGGDGEDLIQEGLLGLMFAIRGYKGGSGASFKTFAAVCIRRRIYSALRQDARAKNLPLNTAIFSLSPEDCEAFAFPDPADILIDREQFRERTEELKNELSVLETRVLDMYLEGSTCAEIALRLDKSGKSVDNAIQRVRRKAVRIFEQA